MQPSTAGHSPGKMLSLAHHPVPLSVTSLPSNSQHSIWKGGEAQIYQEGLQERKPPPLPAHLPLGLRTPRIPILESPALNGTAAAFSLREGGNCHFSQPQTEVGANQNTGMSWETNTGSSANQGASQCPSEGCLGSGI